MNTIAHNWRGLSLALLSLIVVTAMLLVPPFAQPLWYHNFADQRPLLGIPHMLNVVSNLPFLIVGIMGCWFLTCLDGRRAQETFMEPFEWWFYLVFFLGIGLTGLGSAWYHSNPNNDTLLWDRLPLAVAFMALFSAVVYERVSQRAGRWLFVPLVLLGAGSVIWWHQTEVWERGDLRIYVLVQFYPMLAFPLILCLFKPRYTGTADLVGALACYVVAKVLEALDAHVYSAGQIVSGHTLKHLLAAGAPYLIFHMVKNRRRLVH